MQNRAIDKVVETHKVAAAMDILLSGGLLQPAGQFYKFSHKTFQEYFAGRYLARQLGKPGG